MTWHGNGFLHYWPFVRGISADSPLKRPVMQSFDVCLCFSLNELLNKQPSCSWFEIPWRSCDVGLMKCFLDFELINIMFYVHVLCLQYEQELTILRQQLAETQAMLAETQERLLSSQSAPADEQVWLNKLQESEESLRREQQAKDDHMKAIIHRWVMLMNYVLMIIIHYYSFSLTHHGQALLFHFEKWISLWLRSCCMHRPKIIWNNNSKILWNKFQFWRSLDLVI